MKTENFHLILYKITATTTYQSQSGKQGEDFPHTYPPSYFPPHARTCGLVRRFLPKTSG